jgi:hypothetical protein
VILVNKRGDWNHLKITQTKPEQYTGTTQNQGNAKKKKAIVGTAHVLWKVLTYKYKSYLTCKITLHIAQIVNTEQLQHYIN